ncbi:phosphatidylglycerol lysyltransferase domain-containing protein [Amycolatopsis sp. cmx-11-51]|uniref:phosphatidylglycerol lysyltransferase domain-containing protein n=1 Tax=unclassified Amycolatopsis TaxID=2618356 RepID=UPI0039E5DE50
MLLAVGLNRRKRRAWQLAVAAAVLLTVSHLGTGLVSLALLIALIATRRYFLALPGPGYRPGDVHALWLEDPVGYFPAPLAEPRPSCPMTRSSGSGRCWTRATRPARGQVRGLLEVREAAVTYRVIAGVALCSAGPSVTRKRGRRDRGVPGRPPSVRVGPATMGCSELGTLRHREPGDRDEAVVGTETFTLDGRVRRGVRQAVSRTKRAGYTVRKAEDLLPAELDELRTLAATYISMALGRMGRPRFGPGHHRARGSRSRLASSSPG